MKIDAWSISRSWGLRNGMDRHIEYIENGKKAFIYILCWGLIEWFATLVNVLWFDAREINNTNTCSLSLSLVKDYLLHIHTHTHTPTPTHSLIQASWLAVWD
ncbi:hypothetical protein ACMFMF_005064 [Clarireedia jacksonii]